MAKTPRMEQIEAMLADDPDDAFLRYGLAMEHASAGDDAACVAVLRELIARTAAAPYIPAYLQAGQALVRLDRIDEAADVLRAGIDAAGRVGTADALHARGEMQGLLASIE
jgi:thioredoxin-like negative regulator of GroEL